MSKKKKGTPMAVWKKSGHSCPRCKQETEVLIGTVGDHDSVCFAESCWRCGWVAEFDEEEGANNTKESVSGKQDGGPGAGTRSMGSHIVPRKTL